MAPSLKAIDHKLAALDRKRAALRRRLSLLNASHRAWTERRRAVERRHAKAAVRQEAGVLGVRRTIAKGKGMAKMKGAVKTVIVKRVGRPSRWPGLCHACCKRFYREEGGSRHDPSRCAKTQAWLKRQT